MYSVLTRRTKKPVTNEDVYIRKHIGTRDPSRNINKWVMEELREL